VTPKVKPSCILLNKLGMIMLFSYAETYNNSFANA